MWKAEVPCFCLLLLKATSNTLHAVFEVEEAHLYLALDLKSWCYLRFFEAEWGPGLWVTGISQVDLSFLSTAPQPVLEKPLRLTPLWLLFL